MSLVFLTLRDIAARLSANPSTVRSWYYRGKLPPPTVLVGTPGKFEVAVWDSEGDIKTWGNTWARERGYRWSNGLQDRP